MFFVYELLINLGLTGTFSLLMVTIFPSLFLAAYSMYSVMEDKVEKINKERMNENANLNQELVIKGQQIQEANTILNELCFKIQNIQNDTQQFLTSLENRPNIVGYPWLAKLYSDISYIEENKLAEILKNKQHPALKASEEMKRISSEKKALTIKLKIIENQLNYYETIFPWLEEFKEVDPIEVYKTIENFYDDDEYSRIKTWLSPKEYKSLSNVEKYQLALDRYKNNPNKTNWQVGIDYERYIGYVYERKGYKVIYNGALERLKDMGRDIIAENDNEILIIQCKYWKKEKTIHEKHIFQLFGTVVLQKLKSEKEVKGIFITSAQLSDMAKLVAENLNIDIKASIPFDKNYPCIKCNINRIDGTKIYHLPFDQQYDRTIIEPERKEFYVSTVKEAEDNGFRKAMKCYYTQT